MKLRFIFLLLTGSSIALAQQAQPKDSVLTLEETVVSATRWDEKTTALPIRVSTVSARQVALQQPQTVADLLGASGEVFIQKSQQAGGSPMIRGFATNRLLYAVDGVRMNTAIFRSGNIQNVIALDAFALESTEILFGPGSVMYGSDAIGGVMSFRTLTPKLADNEGIITGGKAAFRYSSANAEKTAHFDVRVGGQQWGFVTSFTTSDFGDLRMGSHGPDEYLRPFYVVRQDGADVVVANPDPQVQAPSGYKQINLMQKLRYQPTKHWDIQYGFHYSTTADYPRYDRLIRLRNGLPRSAEWRYGPQVWMMHALSATHSTPNALYDQLTLNMARQHFEESRIDRDRNADTRSIREEQVNATSLNLDARRHIGAKGTLMYGLEGVINGVTSTGTDQNIVTDTVETGPSRYPNATWRSLGAYANFLYRASEKLGLQVGMRYNQFGIEADFSNNLPYYPLPFTEASFSKGAVTGTLGAVFTPVENWTIRINVASAFRSPNVDDIGKVFDSEGGAVVVPNPGLKAENAYNAEIGLAGRIGGKVKAELTGYYTLLQNALVRRDFTLNGLDSILYKGELSQVQAMQNAAVATVYGLQAGVEVALPAGFLLRSQVNYQQGREELDNGETSPLRHAAPWFGVTRLRWTSGGVMLEVNARYSGGVSFAALPEEAKGTPWIYATDADGNPYSPGWYTLNFKALYPVTEQFGISAGVENLTDQRYQPYSSGLVAPGRNVVVAVNIGF